jgi:hypothetical protein
MGTAYAEVPASASARQQARVTQAAETKGRTMSTIDEIKAALEKCERRPDRMNLDALELMIAAALADARREGAEQMREMCSTLREDADEIFPATTRGRQAPVEVRDVVEWYSESIRAMPLPTGPRQAVRQTD